MATWVLLVVNIGSDNGLLPDGTKPLPEAMLTYSLSVGSRITHIKAISQKTPSTVITITHFQISYLKYTYSELIHGGNSLKMDTSLV